MISEEIKKFHAGLEIFDKSQGEIFRLPPHVLDYIASVFRDDPPQRFEAGVPEGRELVRVLLRHRIVSYFYWKLSSLSEQYRPPQSMMEEMRRILLSDSLRYLKRDIETKRIMGRFAKSGIRALLLKGGAFSRTLYPDPALRVSDDVDLLLPADKIIPARKVMQELGYECGEERYEHAKELYPEECYYPRPGSGNCSLVEIHWRLVYFSRLSNEEQTRGIFGRAGRAAGMEIMHPVDALLHQALHITHAHTHELRLSWINDINLLARKLIEPEDWINLQKRSLEWGARIAVEKCLLATQVWFGLKIPSAFKDFSCWPAPAEEDLRNWESVVNKERDAFRFARLIKLPAGIMPKVRFVLKIIFPSPTIMRRKFPQPHPWLLPVSYLQRWIKWLNLKNILRKR